MLDPSTEPSKMFPSLRYKRYSQVIASCYTRNRKTHAEQDKGDKDVIQMTFVAWQIHNRKSSLENWNKHTYLWTMPNHKFYTLSLTSLAFFNIASCVLETCILQKSFPNAHVVNMTINLAWKNDQGWKWVDINWQPNNI